MSSRLVAVAVPVPALDRLTYRVPDALPLPVVGARVVVPLGPRRLAGIVAAHPVVAPDGVTLRDLLSVLDAEPYVPLDVLQLTEWVSDYYVAGPGACLASAMPPRALSPNAASFKTVRIAAITSAGRAALLARAAADRDVAVSHERESAAMHTPRATETLRATQAAALEHLVAQEVGQTLPALRAAGFSAAVIARLVERGFIAVDAVTVERDPFAAGRVTLAHEVAAARTLTAGQAEALAALERLSADGGFAVSLLHGVTGSGKTELYLRLASVMQARGRGVLILVPEIALTPAVVTAFRVRFGERVAVQHSGLSPGERHDQWHRIRRGDVDVVVGTRSAVFAPLRAPGLIIVDEEHDTSYKQEELPRYHGRDVAVMRGKFAGALVVLGSATPSLESHFNAVQRRYHRIVLPHRVLDRPMADVRIVNMRHELAEFGTEVVLSRALAEALTARLARREQSLVLLNRRGYAAAVMCRQCGNTVECPNCSVSLTVHTGRREWWARCHYCNHSRAVPKQCPNCAAPYLERVGFGTERVEAEIAQLLPAARIGRVDRDTVRRQGALTTLLSQFGRGELDVLVGTQMIAKGHDFPGVTLVGVISADVGLGMADFRAAERTFQLLTQVAGRAGRGERAGEAIVQTLFPDHYSITLAQAQDYLTFFDHEIQFRKAMRYPPVVAMVNVIVRGPSAAGAMEAAAAIARPLRARASRDGGFVILGPAPAPLTKLKGEHRAQVFLKGTSRAHMRAALREVLGAMPEIARRATIDVDPLTVL